MSHLIIKELSKGYQDGEDIRWVLHDLNFIMANPTTDMEQA